MQALGLFYLGLFWYRRCLEPLAECGARGFDSLQFHHNGFMTYNYYCPKCDLTYIAERSMFAAEVKPECVKCGVVTVRKFESPGATFKGGGFGGARSSV